MELRIIIDYNQILRLIQQLPKRDIERLAITLQSEISSKKSTKSIQELILKAPTWSDSDFNDYQKARSYINKSRIV
ncbi:hypothetical protein ES705_42458 [subsurface metagenome]